MTQVDSPAAVHPSQVLAVYAEALIRGRRVVLFGDARTGLAEALAERGARLVHVYDPSAARAAEALALSARPAPRSLGTAPAVAFAALSEDLGVRDGAFDVAIVPDLSLFDSPDALLRRARRALSSNGVAVIASPNPAAKRSLLGAAAPRSALEYYALFDLVSLQFPKVRMAGQVPFVGYAIAEFSAEGEIPVTVDTSLLEHTGEPELFIAVGSERAASLDPYAVIELPFEGLPAASLTSADDRAEEHAALAELRARVSLVSLELERAQEKLRDDSRRELEQGERITLLTGRAVEIEKALEAERQVAREADARAGDAHVRAERLTHDLAALEEEIARQRERGTKLTKQLEDERRLRQKAEVELGLLRGRPSEAVAVAAAVAASSERLDALTRDLASRDAQVDVLSKELDAKALRVDTLARELFSRNIRIAELEAKLAARPELVAPPAPMLAPTPSPRVEELEEISLRLEDELRLAVASKRALEEQARDLVRSLREAEAALEEARANVDALGSELAAARSENDAARFALDSEADAARGAEIASYEALLVERGHHITTLTKDLAEAERIGKELVGELTTKLVDAGLPTVAELERRLDTLAASAARTEADLVASRLRVAELERKLTERDVVPESSAREVEDALVAAHHELATLRRALAAAEAGQATLAASVSEGAVLLHQVAR
jgi:hypothetical protein